MDAEAIDDDRERRHAIGSQTHRTDEAVFDFDQFDCVAPESLQDLIWRVRFPDGDWPTRHALQIRSKWHLAARPKKRGHGRALPECESQSCRDVPIAVDKVSPEGAEPHGCPDVDLFGGKGILIGN